MLHAPFRSEFDPAEEAEGSIDPLGLQPAYERLADRLLPAVTVRMGHPRFVTAMALGACICEVWDDDEVAADDETPPWLVFEWFVIESFVRSEDVIATKTGIPGINKVRTSVRASRAVSAPAYLRTPKVFGFTGIFRRLARDIGILTDDGRLDDGGYELLAAWAKEQGLDGIVDASTGSGKDFREQLRRVVRQGLEKGQTTHQSGTFWKDLAKKLDPAKPGPKEAKVLLDRILMRAGPVDMVRQVSQALVAKGGIGQRSEEPEFIRSLARKADVELKEILTAIDAYEQFAQTLMEAFDAIRFAGTVNGGAAVGSSEFYATPAAKSALANLPKRLSQVRAHPKILEWENDPGGLSQTIALFETVQSEKDLFNTILQHHEHVQDHKPPHGKRSWFERAPQERIVVRAGYKTSVPPSGPGTYVHEYRIPTFSTFLSDLGAYQ